MGYFPEMIRSATIEDAARIAAIYNYYVESTVITFEEDVISDADMTARIAGGTPSRPLLVSEIDGAILGYAYASPWNPRSAYRNSVETTVYVAHDHCKEGIGTGLYGALIDHLRSQSLHCALGVIALPNPGSVALHEKLGFRKVGELEELGWKLERWVSVGFWQLLL
jgi:phosphinothricin acetyltransferase